MKSLKTKFTVIMLLFLACINSSAISQSVVLMNILGAVNDGRKVNVLNAIKRCDPEKRMPPDVSRNELAGIAIIYAKSGANDKLNCIWQEIKFASKARQKVEDDGIEKSIENANACHYEQYGYELLDEGTSKQFFNRVFLGGVVTQSEEYMECFLSK